MAQDKDRAPRGPRQGQPRRPADGARRRDDRGFDRAPRRDDQRSDQRPRRDDQRPRRDDQRPRRDDQRRPSRPPQDDDRRVAGPALPDDITAKDLHPQARNQLKTLSKENADDVARHLAMAARLIDDDPAAAHEHALAASRRAGRIAVVRETTAITAYATGDFALALRELRTYRRLSGKDDQIALMVDSERGVGRPDRALEVGRAVDRAALPVDVRVSLAIAMSGARLDLGEPDRALLELEIPELDPTRAFDWSPALFSARAEVLEELGRADEAAVWRRRADVAAAALDDALGVGDVLVVEDVEEDQ